MTKVKIQIKNRLTGSILFEYEEEDNTIKDTLIEAVKNNADLRYADLRNADLSNADLSNADLRNADLRNADLRNNKTFPYLPLACPSDGAFIGWKKIGKNLVKLEIPEDAMRCSATTNKCRCDKAKVLDIICISDDHSPRNLQEITNCNFHKTTYKVGEMVYPDSFDEDRWNECSHGIHFFINKQDAINY